MTASALAAFTLHGALVRAAERWPDRPAVTEADRSISYSELETRSAQVARALVELGVEPGDRVAVSAAKSAWTVAALYGTLRAGAAYVPLDPFSPPIRAAHVIADAGCKVICADAQRAARLRTELDGKRAVKVVALGPAVKAASVTADQLEGLEPDRRLRGCESDLAYLLYTSGSTGLPKGVMLTHRNALSFVEWAVGRFGICPDDRLSSHAPFHFDLSVLDLYGAAVCGASVHLFQPGEESFGASMAAVIRQQRLTVWYSVPSALVPLCAAARGDDLASLRIVLFAGEVFPMKHLRRLRDLVPGAVLANLYGPTETNVCTYCVVPRELPGDLGSIPIGRACENQEVMTLDDRLQPVPAGTVGELWVRGPTVMKGYWGDPERTAASLRQNPLHERFPDPAYRTGDLVRELEDGSYEFLGRRDHQVKVRGYRVELGEIEAALVSHPAVEEAAVVAVPDERTGPVLFGFVAARGPVEGTELKHHCSARLPRYMIPSAIVIDTPLPHTSSGKIDRQELARRATAASAQRRHRGQ